MFETATKEDVVMVLIEMRETVDFNLGILELKQTEEEVRTKTRGDEARLVDEEEARLKAEEEAKTVEQRRKAQEEIKMNGRIALWKKSQDCEGAQMLYVNPDAVAQPAIVGEEKGSSRDSSTIPLISAADEMCEENEETHVDVIKDKDKDNINPVI
ncbi:hypothetical protein TNCT_99861 [Trichonephila clavata]|uniref:Uncharacterized protein n=1 Tax=Trichonephila clavata TaxID=2740835 RepID=A0A8X6LNY4_TRICU|nr:hypothetical protein TNCT_99861 [Trichonephila clavata]